MKSPAPLLALTLSTLSAVAFAQDATNTDSTPSIVISASRFADPVARVAANVSVITAEDIAQSPATSLPDLLQTVAGVVTRSFGGSMGVDATVDIRGFGETAGSNTLVLVDGQRLSPVDSGALDWAAIPLSAIERIEVIRGGGTVAFGDRATGGVINVITRTGTPTGATATLFGGSHDQRGLDVQAALRGEAGYATVFAHVADSNGWRDNSATSQQSLSGRIGTQLAGGELFTDYTAYTDRSGITGALFRSDYEHHPRHTRFPDDIQQRDGYRVRPGLSWALGSDVRLDVEAGIASEQYEGELVSSSLLNRRDKSTLSFTPRLKWQHGLGSLASESVFGYDYYDTRVDGQFTGTSYLTPLKSSADQTSSALYLHNTTGLTERLALTTGVRSQRMEQHAGQSAYTADFGFGPFLTPAFSGATTRSRAAYDLGLVLLGSHWRVYGKVGTTFRFANTDELFAFDPVSFNPTFAGDLKPQYGRLQELGASIQRAGLSGKLSVYRLTLTDELGYDPTLGMNTNFDPTRRQGLETEWAWTISEALEARLAYAHADARFRSGAYADKAVPLAPDNKGSVQLAWNTGSAGTYSAVANYVGTQRYAGDFANTHEKMPAYTTLDLQGAWHLQRWTLKAKLLNALDKKYSAYSGLNFTGAEYFYPADPRSLYVSAGYTF